MPRNGSGVFSVANPILVGALRSSTAVNADFSDMAEEISDTLPLDGQAGMTGQFKAAVGTQVSPGIAFASDKNTGIRRMQADTMALVAGGQDRFYIDSTGKAWHLGNANIAGALAIAGAFTGSNDVAALEALDGTGLARRTASNTWTLEDGDHAITWVFDNAGVDLPPNLVADVMVPYACTLTSCGLLADAVGTAVVSIWKDTYANYPPTSADSITGATPPTLTAAIGYTDTSLTGWTKTIAAGDTIRFTLQSATGIKRLAVVLLATRFV